MQVSLHAVERFAIRLKGLVTPFEVKAALNKLPDRPKVGKSWVLVKRLGRTVRLDDTSTSGNRIYGSEIWAIVRREKTGDEGALATVMLVNADKLQHREQGAHYYF